MLEELEKITQHKKPLMEYGDLSEGSYHSLKIFSQSTAGASDTTSQMCPLNVGINDLTAKS